MEYKNVLFTFIILFHEIIKCYIILPFKSNIQEETIYSNYLSTINNNLLSTNIFLGTPQKKVELYLTMEHHYFFIGKGFCLNNNSHSQNEYDPLKSTTFKNQSLSYFNSIYITKAFFSNDNIYLYNDINLFNNITTNKIDLMIGQPGKNIQILFDSERYSGYMGLQMYYESQYFQDYSIIKMLKYQNLVNGYKLMLIFNENKNVFNNDINIKDNEGALIFGVTEKDYEIFFRNNSNYTTIYCGGNSGDKNVYWDINFDKIFYNYNSKEYSLSSLLKGQILIDYDYFTCNEEFFSTIKNTFFKIYLDNNICSIETVETNKSQRLNIIICDKKKFENIMKSFPKILLNHNDLNKIFEFTYNDLFKNVGEKIIFSIFYDENKKTSWTFGRILIKKYQFIFDADAKTITFVDNEFKEENVKENNLNNININQIIWILFLVIGLIGGIFIGKFIWEKTKKKRANELHDDYDYVAKNVDENNEGIIDGE